MNTLSRRRFLKLSGVAGAGALVAGATAVSWPELHRAAATRPLPPGDGILVVVTLYGGNDGMNMVVPVDDPAYHAARAGLSLTPATTLPLAEGLALNRAMPGLKASWTAGRLAVVRGVSYPTPSHSHFQSMDIWQTATPSGPTSSGWLGRWLDSTGTDPLRAIAIDTTLPPLLAGVTAAGATVPPSALVLPGAEFAGPLWAMDARPAGAPTTPADQVRQSGLDLRTVAAAVDPVLLGSSGSSKSKTRSPTTTPTQTPTPPPTQTRTLDAGGGADATSKAGGELGSQLATVATLIAAGVPTRAYAVSLGSFDTHAAEADTSSRLLAELDAALTSFAGALARTPRGQDVTVMVYSEFGRRVVANASQGTDHGTANPVLVLGDRVKGGFVGEQPSLTDLDDGDLKPTTDFRAIYATLLEGVLGGDVGKVLGSEVDTMARMPLLT